ncbi:MAG: hypothetical protein GX376_07305 [Firmicutes bacterium]|nr:hypothetical protein [Bacillota bacterium]
MARPDVFPIQKGSDVMLCQECQMRPATVIVRKTINDKTTEVHLCEYCAREKGELNFMDSLGGPEFSLHKLFASLLDSDAAIKHLELESDAGMLRCPQCGLTYSEFKGSGRLGCGTCYQIYREQLEPLLGRLHGQIKHTGRVPRRAGHSLRIKQELQGLRQALEQAVKKEEFEKAAVLRDKIRDMEKTIDV